MRFFLLLFAVTFSFSLAAAAAESNAPRVEATVDWQNEIILLRADWKLDAQNMQTARADIRSKLRSSLLSRLSKIIETVYARTDIKNPLPDLAPFWASTRLDTFQIAENSASATLQIRLRGSRSLLSFMPKDAAGETWNVDDGVLSPAYDKRAATLPYDAEDSEALLYTGLVIDARHLNFVPSLRPQIYTSSGRLLYGAEFLSRATFVKRGAVGFFAQEMQTEARKRAGERPLKVPALDLSRAAQNSIVISDEDAAKLLAHEGSTQNLRRARVVILLAPDKLKEKY